MKRYLKAFTVYLLLTLADGGLTLYNTPDLSDEGNPLVVYFHLGWGTLIAVNTVLLILIFFICRFVFDKYKTVVADVPDRKSYISQMFYDRPDKFIWSLYKLPTNWKPFWACIGYASYFGICAAALIRDLEWLAVTFNLYSDAYENIRDYFFGRFDIAVGIPVIFVFIFIWFNSEYKKCLKHLKQQAKSG